MFGYISNANCGHRQLSLKNYSILKYYITEENISFIRLVAKL